jgi:hypothetical protein
MPALPSVPKAAKVILQGFIDGTKPWVNLFHIGYSVGGALTGAEVLAMANAVSAAWGTSLAPSLEDTISLANVIVQALDSSTAPVANDPTVHTGGDSTTPVAAGTAFVVKRLVTRRYRGGHSRVYIPGLGAGALNDDPEEWNAATAAAILADWIEVEDSAVDAIEGVHTDASSINISYYEGFTNVLYPSGRYHVKPTPRATPVIDQVGFFSYNPKPCSQRRRQQP